MGHVFMSPRFENGTAVGIDWPVNNIQYEFNGLSALSVL